MGDATQIDQGGMTPIVKSLRVGASSPGAAGTEVLTSSGNISLGTGTITTTGNTTVGPVIGNIQALSGAGAVNLTTLITTVTTTGADALTLADGTAGQIKIITMITDGGDGTLTPTNLAGGTTITFNDVGDSVILCFVDSEWQILANNGATVA